MSCSYVPDELDAFGMNTTPALLAPEFLFVLQTVLLTITNKDSGC